METGTTGAARPVGRRRRAGASDVPHTCPYCGRTFKRSEHKERHVRTHTKEKPFICRCGAAFARRDLLTRHQRIVSHEKHDRLAGLSKGSPNADSEPNNAPVEADMAAAVSLSGMSMNPWDHQARQPPDMYPPNGQVVEVLPQPVPQQFQQPIMPQEFFNHHSPESAGLEFSNFFDGVDMPTEWSPDFQAPEQEEELLDPLLREPVAPNGQSGIPFGCWMPPTPQENRIPELPTN